MAGIARGLAVSNHIARKRRAVLTMKPLKPKRYACERLRLETILGILMGFGLCRPSFVF